jgi:hypothetical protein
MLWKELFVEPRLRLGRVGRVCVVVVMLASLVPVWWFHTGYSWSEPLVALDVWGRLVVTGGACLALLGVAVHAAGSISGERERHTLDSLLTTPLTRGGMLFAKWLGSILSARRTGLILLVVWLVCTGIGGGRGVAMLGCAVAWVVYAGCFAMLGLWFSVTCRSTRRATLWTLGTLALLGLGHWAPQFFVGAPKELKWPRTIAVFGLTPPAALQWVTLNGDDLDGERRSSSRLFERFSTGEYSLRQFMTRPELSRTGLLFLPAYHDERRDVLAGTVAGLLFWLGLTAGLGLLTLWRFARNTS